MITALLLTVAAQAAPATPPAESGKTVVVTARSLKDTERALVDCLARNCPPKEDIDASLAHAENQFISGDYAAARHTLAQSRGRNARYAKALPVEVADLTRAYGRMSNFDGYSDVARILQIDSLDALKAGLDKNDSRVLMQRMMVGDEFVRQGRVTAAEQIYDRVERQAKAAGLIRVQGFAMLRQAVVFGALASVEPAFKQRARQKLARLERTTEPELALFRDAVALLRARLAALDGDEQAIDAAVQSLANKSFARPVLIHSPAIKLDAHATSDATTVTLSGDSAPQWIDVAFEITPAGRVSDIDILRQSSNVAGSWPSKVREALAARRYSPVVAQAGVAGMQRIERFSMVFDVTSITRSRIRNRSPIGRIVSLDLTPEPA